MMDTNHTVGITLSKPATFISEDKKSAKMHVKFAAMNSGKSTMLLQIAHHYEEMGKKVLLCTFAGDDRAGVGIIASRLGVQRAATTFDAATNFFDMVKEHEPVDCILIDEAQFMQPSQSIECHKIAAMLGIPVICFMLRTDFQGIPFPGSSYLLALADDVQEVKALCHCGRKSTMNMRLDETGKRVRSGEQILIGGNSR